jgi:hypothetical protein
MAMVFMGLGGLFYLVGFVFWVIIIINAFKTDTTQGILCLCVPIYILYWVFAKFTHPKKGLIVGGFLGGYILGAILYGVSASMAASAMTDQMQQYQMPGAVPGATAAWPTQ